MIYKNIGNIMIYSSRNLMIFKEEKKRYKHSGFLAEKTRYISVKSGNNGQESPI